MVIDNEIGGTILRSLRGIEVNQETMAVDIIHQCAIDPGHFLGNAHTLDYMNSEFLYPKLMDRERTDTWEKEGKTELFERATVSVKQMLSDHFPNYFGSLDERMTHFLCPEGVNLEPF